MLHSHSLCGNSLVTHLLTYISIDLGSMAAVDLLTLTLLLPTPHSMGIVALNEVLKSPLPNKNRPLVAVTQSPGVACHPSGIYPSTFQGTFLEVIWQEWAVVVQGWPQQLRFRSCRPFIGRSSAWGAKVLSSWWFTVCTGGVLCLCQAKSCYLSFYLP